MAVVVVAVVPQWWWHQEGWGRKVEGREGGRVARVAGRQKMATRTG